MPQENDVPSVTSMQSFLTDNQIPDQLLSLKKQNWKLKVIIILLIIFLILVTVYLILPLFIYSRISNKPLTPNPSVISSTPQPTTQTQTETTIPNDWTTYENNEYNFSFKYPSNLFWKSIEGITFFDKNEVSEDSPPPNGYLQGKLSIVSISNGKTLKQYIDSYLNPEVGFNPKVEYITINGYSMAKVMNRIFISNDKLTIDLANNGVSKDVLDQILSTFKFTNDKESCIKLGGKWEGGIEECNMPTNDSGKVCFDSSECEGVCIAQLSQEEENKVVNKKEIINKAGKCSAYKDNYGCFPLVENGKVDKITCFDI